MEIGKEEETYEEDQTHSQRGAGRGLLATAAAGCQKSEQGAANGKTVIVGAATDLKTLDTGYMYEVYGNMVSYSLYDMLFQHRGGGHEQPQAVPCH